MWRPLLKSNFGTFFWPGLRSDKNQNFQGHEGFELAWTDINRRFKRPYLWKVQRELKLTDPKGHRLRISVMNSHKKHFGITEVNHVQHEFNLSKALFDILRILILEILHNFPDRWRMYDKFNTFQIWNATHIDKRRYNNGLQILLKILGDNEILM